MDNNDVFETDAEIEAEVEANESNPLLGTATGPNPVRDKHGEGGWPGLDQFKHLPWWQRPSIFWLLPPQLLFTLAFGGIIVPKLNLIKNLVCRDYLAHQYLLDPSFQYPPVQFDTGNDQCRIAAVQSRATQFMLAGSVIVGLLSAFTSPVLGSLSDRFGRTRIMLIPTIGSLVGELLTICAAYYPETFPVNWLYLGFVVDGICGSFTASMAVSYAYATDCTPPSVRNVAFGYMQASLFLGIALGPLFAGLIIKATGSLLSVFYIALSFHGFFLFCLVFLIPESLTKASQIAAQKKQSLLDKVDISNIGRDGLATSLRKFPLVPIGFIINLFEPLKILYPTGPGTTSALRRNLILLSAVDTILFGVAMGSMTVVIYYTDYQFGWSTTEQSYFMSIANSARVFSLLVILPLVTRIVRGTVKNREKQSQHGCDNLDLYLIRTSTFFDAMGYLGYTLARSGTWFTISACVAAIGGMGSPTLQSSLTKHIPHEKVGQFLGANGLLHALARVVAPVIFQGIYSVTVGKFTQTVFVCLCTTFFAGFVLSWGIRKGIHLHEFEAPGNGS